MLQHEKKQKQKIMSNNALKGVCLFEAYRKHSKVVFDGAVLRHPVGNPKRKV
jgi:hypothetical protein